MVVFKGSLKVKVGSYQSLETGSCHRPVLSEYQYLFSSERQYKYGAPQRDSSTHSESWIIVQSWLCWRFVGPLSSNRLIASIAFISRFSEFAIFRCRLKSIKLMVVGGFHSIVHTSGKNVS